MMIHNPLIDQATLVPEEQDEAYRRFQQAYPTYRSTQRLGDLRRREYARLDKLGHVYLDYTGGSLYATSQLRQHMELLQDNVFGNPHSHNPTSLAMTGLVERARAFVLEFFNASPEEYLVIFTPNASGALKLVGESYPFAPGGRFTLAADDHNSVNGIREFARAAGGTVSYAPLTLPDLRLDRARLDALLAEADPQRDNLFAFPAQSNYSGVKHPLGLVEMAQARGWDVLLDAAAFVPTNRLDLSQIHPDFVSLSFYKMFGYPTGVGALIARRSVLAKMRRPWFAGGTVKMVSVRAFDHILAENEAAYEEGTINYLTIPAVEIGLRHIAEIGIETIGARVQALTGWLIDALRGLRHDNDRPVCLIHGPQGMEMRGGTITVSFFDPAGTPISGQMIERLAAEYHISIRTGCFCNPGSGETAFDLPEEVMSQLFTNQDEISFPELVQKVYLLRGVDISAVRVSLGLVSNFADVYRFRQFAATFRNRLSGEFPDQVMHPVCEIRETP